MKEQEDLHQIELCPAMSPKNIVGGFDKAEIPKNISQVNVT